MPCRACVGRASLRGTYSEALLSLERPSRVQDIERLASGLPSLSVERLSSGLGSMHMVSGVGLWCMRL